MRLLTQQGDLVERVAADRTAGPSRRDCPNPKRFVEFIISSTFAASAYHPACD
jgi:hypothetical protein